MPLSKRKKRLRKREVTWLESFLFSKYFLRSKGKLSFIILEEFTMPKFVTNIEKL